MPLIWDPCQKLSEQEDTTMKSRSRSLSGTWTITGEEDFGSVAIFQPWDKHAWLMNHGIRIRLFGMLATGAVGVFVYSRIAKLSFRRLLDVFALPTLFVPVQLYEAFLLLVMVLALRRFPWRKVPVGTLAVSRSSNRGLVRFL